MCYFRGAGLPSGDTGRCSALAIAAALSIAISATITYEQGPAMLSIGGRFINAGVMDVTLIGPTDAGYDPALPNSISVNRLPSRFYFDLGGSFEIFQSGNSTMEVYGAVRNLLDKEPPINVYSGSGTNPYLFDTILRRFTLGVRFSY